MPKFIIIDRESIKPENLGNNFVIGRPINLRERAPSWHNETLRICAREYYVGQIVPTIQYLISDVPIDVKFWRRAGYSILDFEFEGKTVRLSTNHGSEECMRKVIAGELDISDWILDLTKLVGSSIKDRDEREAFLALVQKKVENGIIRVLIE